MASASPTVIDELVISLGLDPKKFTEGQKQAIIALQKLEEQAAKSGKDVEAQSKKLLDFFTNIKREAIGLVAAFYGGRGIGEIVSHITQLDSSTARLSRTMNVNKEVLGEWQSVMRQTGGSTEDARSVMQGLQTAAQDFFINGTFNPDLFSLFGKVGLKQSDIDRPDKILDALASLGQSPEMQAHPERFAAWANKVPGMNQTMINALLDPKLNDMRVAARKVATDGGLGLESERFIQSMSLLTDASNSVARVMLDHLVPVMDGLRELFTKWLRPQTTQAEDEKFVADAQEIPAKLAILSDRFASWVDYGMWGTPVPPPKPSSKTKPGTGGTQVTETKDGFVVTQDGVVSYPKGGGGIEPLGNIVGVDYGPLIPGAKGAAAIANVNNSRSSSSDNSKTISNDVRIGAVNVHAPNAKDAGGIAAHIKHSIADHLGGNELNGAY